MLRAARSIVYAFLRWAIARVLGQRHTREPLAKVRRAVEAGEATLLDVREASEWEAGHLLGAVPLPLSRLLGGISGVELTARVPTGRPVYTYCAAGGRSLIAAASLEKRGYEARPLRPGFGELSAAGFPVAVG
jgi:rhodanese-related sulfurtransferase